jgi:hypothetical protein
MYTFKIKKFIGANTKWERVVIDKLPNLLIVLVCVLVGLVFVESTLPTSNLPTLYHGEVGKQTPLQDSIAHLRLSPI